MILVSLGGLQSILGTILMLVIPKMSLFWFAFFPCHFVFLVQCDAFHSNEKLKKFNKFHPHVSYVQPHVCGTHSKLSISMGYFEKMSV